MTGTRIALAFICAAVVLLTPASLATTPALAQVAQGNQGLQGGWAVDDSGRVRFFHSSSDQFPIMRDAGAGWVRINFRLGACFSSWTTTTTCAGTDGATALAVYDKVVDNARSSNLKILGLFSNESWPGSQAQWTANNAENNPTNSTTRTGDNAYVKAFSEQAVRVVVDRYKGKISQWEIWNEPNAWTYLDPQGNPAGGSFLYPSNFAWLLKRSHTQVKAVQPGGTVIAGGIFGHDNGDSP